MESYIYIDWGLRNIGMWGLLAMLMISIVSYATWRGNPDDEVYSVMSCSG
ncbi:MAG: hypothetical protein IBX41_04645 [Methanophagales archaeon]|nr:hypothetical protein [Methanophagales archaeon]